MRISHSIFSCFHVFLVPKALDLAHFWRSMSSDPIALRLRLLTNPTWNPYRYIGDSLHDVAMVFILGHICCKQSVQGLSFRTQCVYLSLYMARYLDLLDHEQHAYLVLHKIYFMSSALLTVLCFCQWKESYQKDSDTCPALSFCVLTLCISPFVSQSPETIEYFWTWSQILESFAMVPQYVCSYRNAEHGTVDLWGVSVYVCLMGSYRFFYLLNWFFKKSIMQHYWDPRSWLGGLINFLFFFDYMLFRLLGVSYLRRLVLQLDDGIHQVGEELKDRLGGCLLSPGQRYVEITPRELSENYAPPVSLGLPTT